MGSLGVLDFSSLVDSKIRSLPAKRAIVKQRANHHDELAAARKR